MNFSQHSDFSSSIVKGSFNVLKIVKKFSQIIFLIKVSTVSIF